MLNFILASANKKKANEILELVPDGFFGVTPASVKLEVDESANTFWQNALIKAQTYFNHFKAPTLSDDSGLLVEALPDELGVKTARFGGEGLNDTERYELLLKRISSIEEQKRKAAFVCVLCFYLSPTQIYFFEGRLNGAIAAGPCGNDGFGYDPVFLPENAPENKSLAQLPEWKKAHSHRAKAMQHAINFLKAHPQFRFIG